MLKKVSLLTCALALMSACNPTSGTLTVLNPLKVKATISNPWGEAPEYREETLKPGQYEMDVESKSDRELTFKIKANGGTELSVKIPSDMRIPEDGNADIVLPGSKSGQPFDLTGFVQVQTQDSESRREWESCTATREEQVCGIGIGGHYECYTRVVTYIGRRDVEYVLRTKSRNITLNFNQGGSPTADAGFTGTRTDTDRIYSYQGICF